MQSCRDKFVTKYIFDTAVSLHEIRNKLREKESKNKGGEGIKYVRNINVYVKNIEAELRCSSLHDRSVIDTRENYKQLSSTQESQDFEKTKKILQKMEEVVDSLALRSERSIETKLLQHLTRQY